MSDYSGAPPVVTLGENMVLFFPTGGESLERAVRYDRSFGGAEGNFAIAMSRLGIETRWIGRLGNDPFGRYIQHALGAEQVQVRAILDDVAPTAVFFKEKVATGPRRVVYYRAGSAASRMSPADLAASDFAGSRLLHLTGITPALSSTCAATVEQAFVLARAEGCIISFDPNVRLKLWPDVQRCRECLLPLCAAADVVLLGDEDALILFPDLSERQIPRAVQELGPSTVVLKLGARGACGVSGGTEAQVPIFTVPVVDTVGAGDGFDAGFMAGMLHGWPLADCLRLGARVGAGAVSASGDWEGYPRLDIAQMATEMPP